MGAQQEVKQDSKDEHENMPPTPAPGMLRSAIRAVTVLLKLKQLSEGKPGTTGVTGASEAA